MKNLFLNFMPILFLFFWNFLCYFLSQWFSNLQIMFPLWLELYWLKLLFNLIWLIFISILLRISFWLRFMHFVWLTVGGDCFYKWAGLLVLGLFYGEFYDMTCFSFTEPSDYRSTPKHFLGPIFCLYFSKNHSYQKPQVWASFLFS